MAATLLGAGAFIDAFNVSDGNSWLWSSKPGTASRVNANSGRVDMRQPLVDARGHKVRVTQNDKYLILHDLDSGRVTSVDLTRMGFTGTLNVGANSDISVVLHGDTAAIVDRTKGLVRGIDPVTLRASKDVLRLPPPLTGGAFDGDGKLWLAVPSQGTVVAAKVGTDAARSERSEVVGEPDGDLGLTVLDHGALAIDRAAGTLAVVEKDGVRKVEVGALADAQAPARTVGKTVAVTSLKTRTVTVLKLGETLRPTSFRLPAGITAGVAVPYQDRIYVPDEKRATVYVFSPDGAPLDPVEMDGAEGELELEVREGKLFINSPETAVARVVAEDGSTQEVNKYREDVAGGEGLNGRVLPAPDRGNDKPGDNDKQGPPGPPVPVTAVAGDGKVNLSWGAAAANGDPIDKYDVTWDGGSERVGGGDTSMVIDGLKNGSTYTFTVRATNRFGEGPPALSEPVTPTDRIPGTPQNVRAAAAPAEGGARVTWSAVGGARDYVVTTLENGAPSPTVTPQTVNGNEAVITGLTYGQPYRFTVMARNDSGAGSAPSRPSNEVRPYAAPAAPQNASATGTGDDQITVRWDAAADNGNPITKYVVTPSTGNPVTVGGDARSAVINGLPTGETVTFEIRAHNGAGAGQPASASAKVGRAPSVTINSVNPGATQITVNFSVNDYGYNTNCSARVEGGSTVSGNCSSITIGGLQAGRTYTVVVTATNQIGSGTARRDATTDRISGAVRCINDTNSSDPDRRTYCNPGITVYSDAAETSSGQGKVYNGNRFQAVCKKADLNGRTHTAYVYNDNKTSKWWIKMGDGRYIMHVWLNLDQGDGDTANLAILPTC
ncbi:MAG: fibronectin type III domain-containing protein [Micromonosporaceae bacterium]